MTETSSPVAPTPLLQEAAPPPLPSPAPRNPWGGFALDLVLSIGGVFALSTLFIVPIFAYQMLQAAPGTEIDDIDAQMQAMTPEIMLAAMLAMLATALLMWVLRGRSLPGEPARMAAVPAFGLAAAVGLAVQGVSLAVHLLLASQGAELAPTNAEPLKAMQAELPVVTWLMVILVGPFAEELLFRHVLLRRFVLAGRAVAGVVATSLVFAAMHEIAPGESRSVFAWLGLLAVYVAMGAGFGWVYVRTGRFLAAFASHAVCNAAALALMAFSAS